MNRVMTICGIDWIGALVYHDKIFSNWGKNGAHIYYFFALLSTTSVSNLILALRLANLRMLSVRQQFSQGAAYHFSEMSIQVLAENFHFQTAIGCALKSGMLFAEDLNIHHPR